MTDFLTLAGELFLILCVQWVLEAMAERRENHLMQRPIAFGCYLASLWVVLRFMERYFLDILRTLRFFF